MNVREKFELSGGITILACAGSDPGADIVDRVFHLVLGGQVRQTLKISGERKLHNQKSNLHQRALETTDVVLLSQEEARSGEWELVSASSVPG